MREVAQDTGRGHKRIAFHCAIGGIRCHRTRGIANHAQVAHTLLVELANERLAASRGCLPINIRDLVTRLVVLQVVEILATALEQGATTTSDQTTHLFGGRDLYLGLDPREKRRQSGPYGSGTAEKTASMIVSGVIPLASASKVSTSRWRKTE